MQSYMINFHESVAATLLRLYTIIRLYLLRQAVNKNITIIFIRAYCS